MSMRFSVLGSTNPIPARRGFTLIEILIVVVILGILAAIIVPQFSDAQSLSRATAMRTQLNTIRGQVAAWRLQNGNEVPGGSGSTATEMMRTLVEDGYLVRTVFASTGFEWVWNPVTCELDLRYDVAIDPSIPDADGDGDGDDDDVAAIAAW
jgi:prepilin-type N-terminal cleavage/methylation domain-containing protein